MEPSLIPEVVARLGDTDFSTLNAYGLDRAKDDVARLRSFADAVTVKLARRAKQLAAEGKCGSPSTLLGSVIGSAEARAAERRDAVAEALPELGKALDDGDVTGPHLDKAATALGPLKPKEREHLSTRVDEIVAAATSMTPDEFGRHITDMARETQANHGADTAEQLRRQRRISTRFDENSKLTVTSLHADPESNAILQAALDKARESARQQANTDGSRTFEHIYFDEVLRLLVDGAHRNTNGAPISADITVIVDAETLKTGVAHDGTVCEYRNGTPAPVSTVQRLCCDGDIHLATLNEHGVILNLGRAERLANREQRRALRAMHRTCAYPHCTVSFERCRIHHIDWWEHNGPTDLANLVPVCNEHHHLLHEGNWRVQLADPDTRREAQWYRPDGQLHGTSVPDATRMATQEPVDQREPVPPPGGPPDQFGEQATLFTTPATAA